MAAAVVVVIAVEALQTLVDSRRLMTGPGYIALADVLPSRIVPGSSFILKNIYVYLLYSLCIHYSRAAINVFYQKLSVPFFIFNLISRNIHFRVLAINVFLSKTFSRGFFFFLHISFSFTELMYTHRDAYTLYTFHFSTYLDEKKSTTIVQPL